MSLLDNAKKNVAAEPAAVGTSSEVVETKKKSNSDYQKRQREHQYKAACTIRDFLKSKVKDIPADIQDELDFLCKEKKPTASKTFGKPTIYKLFGNAPKVGDKITALKVFEDTGKGFAEMRQLIKKWAAQNITVAFDEASKSYVIKAGTIPAYVEA